MPARLPDLVVIGAPRSGTTTLVQWLRAHPGAAVSDRKELEFFDLYHHRGLDWYLSQLPQEPGDRVVVEGTPTYLSDAHAPDRIAAELPATRFVAVLREPVARAWSQYWFFVQLGLEGRTWQQVVAAELRDPESRDGTGCLWRGRYGEQLARWERLVGRDRVHVLLLEDLVQDPDAALAGVCEVAGLPALPAPGRSSVNPTRLPRSRALQRALHSDRAGRARRALFSWNGHGRPVPALPESEQRRLAPLFAPDLHRLEDWLGRPLPASWHPLRSPAAAAPVAEGMPR